MKKLCLLILSFTFGYAALAQGEEEIFLQVGVRDSEALLQDYFSPLFKGIGYGFTSGWYNTAETHKPLGFDISLSANLAFIPKKDLSFLFNNENYERIHLSSLDAAQVPTVFGSQSKNDRQELRITDENGTELVRVSTLPGAINLKQEIGANVVPVPMVQFGIGLIKGTDLKIRFIPKMNFDKGSAGMFGLGLQHDVAQWIGHLSRRDISISLLGAFNGLYSEMDLSYDDIRTANNKGLFRINGLNLQAIASKEYYDLITIYGAVGYARASSRIQILGTYPIGSNFNQLPENPIDLRYSASSMNASIGIMVKLLFVTGFVAHTFQQYQVTSMGVGISIR
jgi:hypothetical protein